MKSTVDYGARFDPRYSEALEEAESENREMFHYENWDAADDVLMVECEHLYDMIDDCEFVPEIGHVYQLEDGNTISVDLSGQVQLPYPSFGLEH